MDLDILASTDLIQHEGDPRPTDYKRLRREMVDAMDELARGHDEAMEIVQRWERSWRAVCLELADTTEAARAAFRTAAEAFLEDED